MKMLRIVAYGLLLCTGPSSATASSVSSLGEACEHASTQSPSQSSVQFSKSLEERFIGEDRDGRVRIFRCLNQLSAKGDGASAHALMSALYYRINAFETANYHSQRSLERGERERRALYIRARCLSDLACGAERDPNSATQLYRASAEEGFAPAMFWIGMRELSEPGVTGQTAEYWLGRAANLGYVDAITNLGVLYGRGEGVRQNAAAARAQYRRAAEAGSAAGAFSLGVMLITGDGGPQSPLDGAALLELSDAAGYPLAKPWIMRLGRQRAAAQDEIATRKRGWVNNYGAPSVQPRKTEMDF